MRAVITYHSIDPSNSAISISEAEFRRHIQWLASGSVPVVPLEAILSAGVDSDAIALTFDDGFKSFGEIALDLLSEHSLASTVFIVTGKVGGTNAWEPGAAAASLPVLTLLDWAGIARAVERGVTLGSHGRTHRRLPSLEQQELEDELSGSLDDFRRELGISPATFCYPYGDATERERTAAARAYRVAVTTELRPIAEDEDPYAVPRVDAYYLRRRGRLESFGTPAFARYLRARRQGRSLKSSVGRLLGRGNE
ncbi:MAG TPA: polysaccharide deacetylase family protein [Gemmatimonadaceae bacterium]|nr:polysaccharide deacetylase family protein [Gemmatimonadaceae bacterium]